MTAALVAAVGLLAVATALGTWWRARNGVLVATQPDEPRTQLTTAQVGAPLGSRLTWVQMSSEYCAPCRRTARVLAALAADEPGTAHLELAVEEHADLARQLHVLRTPTVVVLDPEGHIVGRLSGAVTPAQARGTLAMIAGRHDAPA